MPPANSAMLELGTPLPSFTLPDFGVEGDAGARSLSSGDLPEGRPVLVAFICNHCPFVIHIQDQLASLGRDYADRLSMIAINANNTDRRNP